MLTAIQVTARDVASAPKPRKPLGALFRRRSPLSSPVFKPVPWSPHNLPELTCEAIQCIPLSPAARDADWVPGLRRSPGGGHGIPLQCSCLEHPMARAACQAAAHGATNSQTCLGTVPASCQLPLSGGS